MLGVLALPAVLLALAPFHGSSEPLPAPVRAQLKAEGVLAFRLPGRTGRPAAAHGLALGLRRTGAQRAAGRQRHRGRPARARLSQALRAALPDPPSAAGGHVRPDQRPAARQRRQRLVRLPGGRPVALHRGPRHRHLVDARLRTGRGRQPGRESLRRLRAEPRPRGQAVLRPLAPSPRDGDAANDRGLHSRSAGAGAAPGRATPRTTCTSQPTGTDRRAVGASAARPWGRSSPVATAGRLALGFAGRKAQRWPSVERISTASVVARPRAWHSYGPAEKGK